MPSNNDTVVCPEDLNSCYFLFPQANATYATATSKCTGLGGTLVQWSISYEQRVVETYFRVPLLLPHACPCCCSAHCHVGRGGARALRPAFKLRTNLAWGFRP
jgi:hypothetical protein